MSLLDFGYSPWRINHRSFLRVWNSCPLANELLVLLMRCDFTCVLLNVGILFAPRHS